MLTAVLILLIFHGLLGGADVMLNHELSEHLPHQRWARQEQALHSAREAIFGTLFAGLAWLQWGGALVYVLGLLLVMEFSVSMRDTLLEDKTRKLPLLERGMHTVLFINFGAYTALLASVMVEWHALPTGFTIVNHGILSWMLTALAVGAYGWAARDALSYVSLGKASRASPVTSTP